MHRFCLAFAFALVVAVAPTGRAGEQDAGAPAVVVRVKSLGALLQNLNLVVKLVGQDDAALAIEGVIKGKIGKKGLEGIDPTRPFGAYVHFGKSFDELNGALLIPIADEKAFLNLIANLDIDVSKDKAGIYTHKGKNDINVYFRFAHGYVFIASVNAESLQDKNLADPAKVLAVGGDATISVVARIDRIPFYAKDVALKHLDGAILAAQKDGPPNESKAQEAFRVALLGDVNKLGASLIQDAAELRLDIDVRAKEISVDLSVNGKPKSDLARTIKSIGELKSPLASLAKKDLPLAFHGNVHFMLPEELNKAFAGLIDEVAEKSLEGIQNEEKKQAEMLFKALMPTAKAGEFQIAAMAVGPKDDHYAFIGALKLTKGALLGATVRDLLDKAREALKELPEELRKIQLDFDKAGAIAIHRFELPKNPALDQFLDEVAGDRHLYLAFRDDALFFAIGKDALPALKTAIDTKDAAASVPFLFDFDIARMARLMAKTPEHEKLAVTLFPAGESGRVRLAIEGGDALSVRLRMPLNVLEFLVKVTSK